VGNEVIVKVKKVDGDFSNLWVNTSDELLTTDATATAAITAASVAIVAANTGTNASVVLNTAAITATNTTKIASITATTPAVLSRGANNFELDVQAGRVTGCSWVRKFGANPTVGTTEEVIWHQSGAYAGFLSTAIAVRIKAGGNSNDSFDGTAARSIVVSGLDETFTEATEVLTTLGATVSAATSTTFIRVNRLYVEDTGTYTASGLLDANAGTIEVETTDGTTLGIIPQFEGQTSIAVLTVPAGKTLFVKEIHLNVAGSKTADIFVYQRRDADDITAPYRARRIVSEYGDVDGYLDVNYNYSISFPAKTDLWVTGTAISGASTEISAEILGILVTN